jgi:phenylacetate-coenzyme A ligase PaaK-like adenylate-forming protein
MRPLRKTPLEDWIQYRIGLEPGAPFTREALLRHQLAALRESLTHAAASSPFYRRRFAGRPGFPPQDLQGFAALPFTSMADLAADPLDFLAVSQSAVARVVTLRSSGTSGPPKRLFFSAADLERTVDFFHHGMSTLVAPGQRVLILMPGEQPGSVGQLLVEGLGRLGAAGMVHGPVRDPGAAVDAVMAHRPDCLVGIPVQVLAMARHPRGAGIPRGLVRTILLSTDYVPEAIVRVLEETWGCQVFQHYGMTEMGFGGGVACEARDGYHLREADLFVEVVDPETGRGVPEGVSGEVVFTTLAVSAMPLIRYRTGDLARFRPEPCPCGSRLRRLGKIAGRRANGAAIGQSIRLTMPALDEALFTLPGVIDFQAELLPGEGAAVLRLTVQGGAEGEVRASNVRDALARVPAVREALGRGLLTIEAVRLGTGKEASSGAAKRIIVDRRQEGAVP